MTFPAFLTCLEAKKASIPAPEPKSTTVSPSFRLAKLSGAPQPTPSIEESGISANSFYYSRLLVVLVLVKIRTTTIFWHTAAVRVATYCNLAISFLIFSFISWSIVMFTKETI